LSYFHVDILSVSYLSRFAKDNLILFAKVIRKSFVNVRNFISTVWFLLPL